METEAQHTWLLKLHNYNFRVEYTKGKENLVADGLSRREEEENNTCFGISAVQANWVEDVVRSWSGKKHNNHHS